MVPRCTWQFDLHKLASTWTPNESGEYGTKNTEVGDLAASREPLGKTRYLYISTPHYPSEFICNY